MTYILVISGLALIIIFVRKYLQVTRGIKLEKLIFNKDEVKKGLMKAFHGMKPGKRKVALGDEETQIKILFTKAMAAFENGDIHKAQTRFEELLALDKNHKEANSKVGLIYLKLESFAKAEDIFNKLIKLFPDDPVYYSNLGRALYEQKKFKNALEAYLQALNLDSSRPGRYVSTAEVFRALSDNLKAEEMYKKAIEGEPENIHFLLAFSDFQIEIGKSSQAKYYLRQALKLDPHNRHAQEMLNEIEK